GSGKETALTTTPTGESHAVISPDGSLVAYHSFADKAIYLAATGSGVPQKLCGGCGYPMHWSPDGRRIAYYEGNDEGYVTRWFTLDPSTGVKSPLAQHPRHDLHSLQFAPDGHWISFHVALDPGRSWVYVAPVRDWTAGGEEEWIQVSDGKGSDARA